MSLALAILVGCVGALVPDMLRFASTHYDAAFPTYIRYPNYWVGLAISVILGGIATWVGWYLSDLTVPDAFIYGYAAPQFFTKLVGSRAAAPETSTERESPKGFELMKWWAS